MLIPPFIPSSKPSLATRFDKKHLVRTNWVPIDPFGRNLGSMPRSYLINLGTER